MEVTASLVFCYAESTAFYMIQPEYLFGEINKEESIWSYLLGGGILQIESKEHGFSSRPLSCYG